MSPAVTFPLSREEFEAYPSGTFEGITLVETDDGDMLFAYGHVSLDVLARSVVAFLGDSVTEADVIVSACHVWAVCVEKDADGEDAWTPAWRIEWEGIERDIPNAFPLTVVDR